jgi:hypothetical protein
MRVFRRTPVLEAYTNIDILFSKIITSTDINYAKAIGVPLLAFSDSDARAVVRE